MQKLSITNEEDRSKALPVPSIGKSVGCLKKKLLILDINGILVDVVSHPFPKKIKRDAMIAKKACEKFLLYLLFSMTKSFFFFKKPIWFSLLIGLYFISVFKRPFCSEFLNFCFEKFDVAVWSSRMEYFSTSTLFYILSLNNYLVLTLSAFMFP